MSGNPTTIFIEPADAKVLVRERLAIAAFTPGHLLEKLAAGFQKHSTAGGNAQKIFALENIADAGDIDRAYVAGETSRGGYGQSGQLVFGLVAAAALAIAVEDPLISNGDGTVRKATVTDVKATLTVAGEADANGDLTFTSVLDGEHGNDVQVILLNAGTGAVTVDGLVVTITPDTGSNTATDVIAQVVADPGASSLIVASTGGTGATEPGNATIANLTGGADGEVDSDETIVGYAAVAVDNSGGGSEARIQLEVA